MHRPRTVRYAPLTASSAIFFSFFLLSFSHLSADSPNNVCRVNSCRPGGPPIRFPFWIRHVQDERCGYPGLDLSCDNRSQTILRLPNSQDFIVDNIDYKQRYVSLKDPDNCLAKRPGNLTFLSSLLVVPGYDSFVFTNCSLDFSDELGNKRVSCLSGEQYTVMFRFADDLAARYFSERGCSTWTVSVPMGWPFSEDSLSLTWDLPECRLCEATGGRCGPKGWTHSDFKCIHKQGLSKQAKNWIIRGIAIAVIVCLFGFGYFYRSCARVATSLALVARHRGQRHVQNNNNNNNINPPPLDALRGAQHNNGGPVMGLDCQTIESYRTIQVDDDGRVPRRDDNSCAICLSEYQSMDMLKTIPECEHYFHADCIDRWLRRNASCPLCRNHPGPPDSVITSN